jgi:GDP-4-dehydro-6-deoxy-D-mannose reductase
MRVLVTGASGFVGRWMVEELAGAGHHVTGTPPRNRLDVNNEGAVAAFVARARPEGVVHLAGMAFGPDATRDPEAAARVNVDGTAVVLEAVRSVSPGAAVVVAGSADVYGSPNPWDLPLKESAPIRPTGPYGRSKLAQEEVALAAAREGSLAVVATRSFNHTGPGQRPEFVAPALARRILAARDQGLDAIRVGNIDVRRDIGDVRDVARAYRLILDGLAEGRIAPGTVVNVATGNSVAIRHVLGVLAEIVGVQVGSQVDPTLVRTDDPPEIVGDSSRLRSLTGWEPRIPLRQTLTDLVESLRSPAG